MKVQILQSPLPTEDKEREEGEEEVNEEGERAGISDEEEKQCVCGKCQFD